MKLFKPSIFLLFIVAGVLASVPMLISACEGDMEQDIATVSTPEIATGVAPTTTMAVDTPTPVYVTVILEDGSIRQATEDGTIRESVFTETEDGIVIETALEPICRPIPTVE